MTSPLFRRHAGTLLLAVGAITSCDGGDLSAPSDRSISPDDAVALASRSDHRDAARALANLGNRKPRPVTCTPRKAMVSSGTFGPSGGMLVVGNSRLIIPGGALRATVTITASTAGDSSSTVNFAPEGLRFDKPAALILDGAGCSLGASTRWVSIVYLATNGSILETIPAIYEPRWKAVAAPIDHFSGYAIAF